MSILETIGFKKHGNKKESNIAEMEPRKLNPEEQNKKIKLDAETNKLLSDIEKGVNPEKFASMTPEKRKLVIDKVKVLCTIGIALGVSVAANFLPELEMASEVRDNASMGAILGGAGALFATINAVMLGLRNAINKERKSVTVKI
jgi:hypothetical protein